MCYQVCLNLEDVYLRYAIAFAYRDLMHRNGLSEGEVFLCDEHLFYMSDGKQGFDDNVPRNTTTVERIGEGDKNTAMDAQPDYSSDVPFEKE